MKIPPFTLEVGFRSCDCCNLRELLTHYYYSLNITVFEYMVEKNLNMIIDPMGDGECGYDSAKGLH